VNDLPLSLPAKQLLPSELQASLDAELPDDYRQLLSRLEWMAAADPQRPVTLTIRQVADLLGLLTYVGWMAPDLDVSVLDAILNEQVTVIAHSLEKGDVR
jgi:hypothetical protein